jgi:hypothetical protein
MRQYKQIGIPLNVGKTHIQFFKKKTKTNVVQEVEIVLVTAENDPFEQEERPIIIVQLKIDFEKIKYGEK